VIQPDIRPIADRVFKLYQDYSYDVSDRLRINVHKGFVFDGNSCPRFAWSLTGITPQGLSEAASLIHDLLYRSEGKPGDIYNPDNTPITRKFTDKLYRRMLQEAGQKPRRIRIAYRMVRAFGGLYWGKPPPKF